ncbi:hypothetical protein BH10CHL1_BH10CHL1_27040 [soil metagenome]
MKSRRLFDLGLISGVLCIIVGLVIPSTAAVMWLRPAQPITAELRQSLLVGITIFKICLVLFGVIVIVLSKLPIWQPALEGLPSTPTPRHKYELPILAVILVIALGLRLYALNDGLWHDEILTYVTYVRSMSLGEIASTYNSENQHFLYNLLARVACMVFGNSNWALRLPAALFGVASIYALYLFGRTVTSAREALLAAALMTFAYHHVWFSQNARGYTGLLLWTLLSSWLLLRGLARKNTKDWLFYAITIALGIYTHTTMLFVVIAHFIIYLQALVQRRDAAWPQRWMGFALGFCFAGFLTLLLHAVALPQVFTGIVETSTIPEWKNPLWTVLEIARGVSIGFMGLFFILPALLVFGVGLWSYLRSKPIVVALLILPVAICTVIVVGLGHHLWPRFFFFAMGFAVLVAVRGTFVIGTTIASYSQFTRPRAVWAGIGLTTAMILVAALSAPFAYGPKQDYQAALAFVEANRQPGDMVTVVGLATYTYENLYKTDWTEIDSVKALNTAREHGKRTWIVYTFPPEMESVYPDIMTTVDHEFVLQRQFSGTLNNGTLFVARSDLLPTQLSSTQP